MKSPSPFGEWLLRLGAAGMGILVLGATGEPFGTKALAQASGDAGEQGRSGDSQSDASAPSEGSTRDAGDISADALARKVVEAAGDPAELRRVSFTFVVTVDGEEKIRRRHRWWPGEGELVVESGGESVTLGELHEYNLTRLAKNPTKHSEAWSEIADEAPPERAAEAWGWFVNDSYWLFAPAKLFDPGVHRSLDEQGRLALTFGDVGLTPGDQYWLTVDRERELVTRWEYELQDGREGSFRWVDYRRFGPLELSTRRVSTDGEKQIVIEFEGVEVKERQESQ